MSNLTDLTKLSKQLAKQISDQNASTSDTESPEELLEALGSVAKMLEDRAGTNVQIRDLAIQVQELVKAKHSKK